MRATPPDGLLLDLQDSQLGQVETTGADLRVTLSTAHVTCPMGSLAHAPEEREGYLAPVVLCFRQARWQGELAWAMGRVADGEWWLQGQRLRRLPLPFVSEAPVRARLALANGVVLTIEAQALECVLTGSEKFTPSLAC